MRRWVMQVTVVSLLLQACAPAALGPALSGRSLVDYFRGFEPKRYLTAALDDMQSGAYYARGLDWTTIRSTAFAQAARARVPSDTYQAIDPPAATQAFLGFSKPRWIGMLIIVSSGTVVQVLPNSPAEHAGVRLGDIVVQIDGKTPMAYVAERAGPGQPADLYGYFFQAIKALVRHPGSEAATLDLQPAEVDFNVEPSGRSLDRVGYLQVTGMNALNPFDPAISAYSAKLTGLIAQEDRSTGCGWIVDLRQNLGGNVAPMANGLAALIGTQPYASVVGRGWHYDFTAESASSYRLNRSDPAIAVLTSPLTGSSGELIAIAFRGSTRWRSFGEPTAGATSSTQQYFLNDGAFLNLMVGIDADRTGHTYGGKLQPDEPLAIDWSRYGAANDPVVAAAVDWLHRQSACA